MSDLLKTRADQCTCQESACRSIQFILEPVEKDLGGFSVRRLLPSDQLKSVGPFVFFDHLGPAVFKAGKGIDVRPHPHIGLATVTYLFEGEILHRDSLGSVQPIRPRAINLMCAGRGIVHSERTPQDIRASDHRVHALQLWLALPVEHEETEPSFFHYPASDLPENSQNGQSIRLMIGSAFGLSSPVKTWSNTLYAEAVLEPEASLVLPSEIAEKAVYVVEGDAVCHGTLLPHHTMVVFQDHEEISITARSHSRLVVIGGEPIGRRTVWWNLVSSRKELIEKAKSDWKNGRFPSVPGETEFIPLP